MSKKTAGQAPERPEHAYDKETLLKSSRWKNRERMLLSVALDDAGSYTMEEARAALKQLDEREVK